MKCSICSSESLAEFLDAYDDRYGYPGRFTLFRCADCGHKMLKEDFTPELLTRLYTDYYPRSSFALEQHKPYTEARGFNAWLDGAYFSAFRWVPKNVRVLDIGCGFGETLGYHKSRGCDAYGVEADKNILRVAEKFGYRVHVGLFDPGLYEPGFFDYVTMDQVLEHTVDPVATLRGIAKVLKPGGHAVLSLPNSNGWGARVFGKKWISWHIPYHIQHFSVKSMEIAAEKAGLKIEKHRTVTNSEWLFCQWIHLATCPKEGEKSKFWTYKYEFYGRQALAVKFIELITRAKFNHLVTRIFDALNAGDNFIFILRKPEK